jgi:single-stranded DNA-binding protein
MGGATFPRRSTVNLTGRLTREPELRQVLVPSPTNGQPLDVCQIRVAACRRRVKTRVLLNGRG